MICPLTLSHKLPSLQNIAKAFGGLETPPGMFSGMEVRKKLYLPSSLHFLASASRSNSSPGHFCQL
jgi:hypothetical protein